MTGAPLRQGTLAPSARSMGREHVRDALAAGAWRWVVASLLVYVGAGAIFPRLRYGGWFARLGPRERIVYIAFRALTGFATRELARRARQSQERIVAELRELGLEPTEDEVRRHYVRRYLRRHLGREPTDQELDDLIAVFRGSARRGNGERPAGQAFHEG